MRMDAVRCCSAIGITSELEFQLGLAEKLDFGALSDRQQVFAELSRVQRMLNRLPVYLRAQPAWRRKEGAPRSERPEQ